MVSFKQQLARLRTTISTFNVFESYTPLDNDPYEHKTQLISTRIFVTLLLLSLTVLLVYTSRVQVTHTITVDSPPLSQYLSLYQNYGDKLICPCTTIAFAQQAFISLTPIFHQVCSSDFVTTQWSGFINAAAATVYVSPDFRYTGGVLFQILASFCRVANETIVDSLPKFYSNSFVSVDVLNSELLKKESQSLIELYITTTANAFTQSFEILRDITYSDGLVSGLFTNVNYKIGSYYPDAAGYIAVPYFESYYQLNRCDCLRSPSCIAQAAIHNMTFNHISNQTLFAIPGLYIGCYLVEAMRQSNLQCFYNQTCLDQLVFYLRSPMVFNATALDRAIPSRFNTSTSISEILAALMVDSWISNISYSSYYTQCQPSQCTYSIIGRNSFIYILTTLIGLFGGLYKALRVTVPFPVKIIRNRRRKIQPSTTTEIANVPKTDTSCCHVLQIKLTTLFQSIRSLNLFEASPPSTDQHHLKTQRISTFVYLISLFVCLLCLITYIANENVTQTVTIKTPSFNDYKALYEKQGTKLTCPCSTITTKYQDFLYIEPEFHQFCSSDFVHDNWLSYTNTHENSLDLFDFRLSASLTFHAMASLCSLSSQTISNDLAVFQSTQVISAELLSENIFYEMTKLLVTSFNQSTIRTFLQNLEFIRTTNYGNQIINGINTNSLVFFQGSYPTFTLTIYTNPHYDNCSCDITSKCVSGAGIDTLNGTNVQTLFTVPGLLIGCYTNEALRQSTLECFFDQSCVDTVKFYLDYGSDFNITALNPMIPSRFNSNTLIDELLNNMMVEQWLWNDSYSNYYTKCQPSSCFYKVVTKTPFIVVITTLIGLFGGLVKILQILVPLVVGFVRRQKDPPAMQPLSLRVRLTNLYYKSLHSVRTLNLFQAKRPSENDEQNVKNQLISTRLFIVLLITSLLILVIYTSRTQVTRTITIESPSLSVYASLYQNYGEKLTCPCTTITIAQKEFISLTASYHQICTSDFVDPSWAEGIYNSYVSSPYVVYNRDFRYRAPYYFQMLASFCSLSNNSLTDALINFYTTLFVSTDVLPERVFNSQVNATIDLFINSVTNAFFRTYNLLRDTTQGNSLVTGTISSLSFRLVIDSTSNINDTSTWPITLRYKTYNGSGSICSCRDTSRCFEQTYVWTFSRPYTAMFQVPGILIGCYTFDALLQSNLNYFYNQTNVDSLRMNLNITQPLSVKALDPSQPSQFQINSTIESVFQHAMIEQWIQNISYIDYYTQCRPIYCKYSIIQKNDVVYIITTITALIGGLTSVLQMVIPRVVKLLRRFFNKNTVNNQ